VRVSLLCVVGIVVFGRMSADCHSASPAVDGDGTTLAEAAGTWWWEDAVPICSVTIVVTVAGPPAVLLRVIIVRAGD
jgi:hypothetical protein